MPSIDERIVSMAFENQVFEQRVAQTMSTLGKLDTAIKNIGQVNGLQNIEASANKVTLLQPLSALDKLRARLGGAGQGAAEGFSQIEKAGSKVSLLEPLSALDKLSSRLGTVGVGAQDGFSDISKAAAQVDMRPLNASIDSVQSKFSELTVIATAALTTITMDVTRKARAMANSFTLGPIQQGLEEYKTNLNSIQTILANTEGQQVSGLKAVNEHLAELNHYSDQTIYNFSEMAKNIGTFTAAGVDLPKATQSIKGIANLAALSGSNSQQAATAMYQLSQAISAGRVGLQDWNSVVNAGMGGAVFQKSLMRTAENMGALAKGAVEIDKATGKATVNGESFRNSIMAKPGEESWLSSEVLVETLKQFTGDMKEADLIAQGFSKTQAQAIMQQAATAKAAATEVKTLSQAFDVARETIGSGWATTFQNIFGNFEESKKTFTELSNTINGFINASSDARNKVLGDWKALGGRDQLIDGLRIAWHNLVDVLTVVKDAFRDIFPAKTGAELFGLTNGFVKLMIALTPSPELLNNLQRIFAGLFAVLHIGWTIVKNVAGVIFDLLGVVGQGSGGILNFTGSIGDFLVALDQAISKGDALGGFFEGLTQILSVPLKIIQALASAFFSLFDGADGDKAKGVADSFGEVEKALGPLTGVLDAAVASWERMIDILDRLRDAVSPWLNKVSAEFSNFTNIVKGALENADWDSVFAALQTGILGGLFLAIKKALGGGLEGVGAGLLGNLSKAFGALTGNLQAMQKNIQADTLLKIAGAIAVLAAGVFLLSTIDAESLNRAMTAVAIGMGQLVGALALLSKAAGGTAFLTLPFIAASMIGLAVALVILAGAMKIFATMSWTDLAKGLVGVGGTLAAVGAASQLINGPKLIAAGLAMIPLAIGITLLAAAVKQFATLSWEDLGKGLAGVAVALGVIAVAMNLMPPTLLLTGAGLIAVGIGVSALAGAVRAFGGMDFKQMMLGIFGLASALVAIGMSIALIPPTVALQAAGLVILAAALSGIAGVIKVLGGMDVGSLVKGVIAIGGALVVLAGGLMLMTGTLPGAVALMAAAAALAVLGPTLAFLGTLEWGTIFKGLVAIAGVLGVLALVGGIAAPALSALGVALLPLAGVFVASALAVLLFAKALQLLGSEGTKGIGVMVAAITAFVALIPTIVINFIKGLVEIVGAVAKVAPQVLAAIGTMLTAVIAFVTEQAPKLAVAIGTLVDAILTVLLENAPKIVSAGFQLLTDFLSGIASNIGQVASQAAEIITKFLDTLTGQSPDIAQGGVGVLLGMIGGITSKIPNLVEAAVNLIVKFVGAIVGQVPKVISAVVNMMIKFVGAITGKFGEIASAGVRAILKFVEGAADAIPRVVAGAVNIATRFVTALSKGLVKLTNVAFDAMIDFLNGFAQAIRENGPRLRAAGWNVADAIIDGIVQGFQDLAGKAVDAVKGLVSALPNAAKKALGIKSPSRVFAEIGRQTMAGMTVGLNEGGAETIGTIQSVAQDVIRNAENGFGNVSNLLDGMLDLDPTVTPVLDLSLIEREAGKLSDLTNVVPITAAASFGQASAASQEVSASQEAAAAEAAAAPTFSFEQNNYSPEALSDVEIYRKTKNQLGQLKTALGIAV